ncbi:putative cucumisin [Dioscorea sansibarensis]
MVVFSFFTNGISLFLYSKLIGARYYNADNFFDPREFKSPRDAIGHGTHTSSTAAGRAVCGANYFGLAEGEARGAVPEARIAMYKVCWLGYGCSGADILKAFDDAIADGVDVISVSLGSGFPFEYYEDPIAIGSFHAMKKGILTSNSAGNSGPFPISVANYAPWSLTVAASSIDRKFVSNVVLGNGNTYIGIAINNFNLGNSVFPLIYGGDAVNFSAGSSELLSSYCVDGLMNSQKVRGNLVLCNGLFGEEGIPNANGLGVILSSDNFRDVAFNFRLPATVLSNQDAQEVLDYIRSSSNPIGTIKTSDEWNDTLAPTVVSFSSRGPNPITPDILKPDLTAPGVDIIAAWSPAASPTFNPEDKRITNFNIISGTSMSCPHATGAAAYVKSAHPSWSPAAIKSALMTTATPMDPRKNEDAEFAYGAGHINPVKAVDPGLIFDASEQDYITFLCKQGYNTSTLQRLTGDNCTCNGIPPGKAWDLNYPSFSLSVPDNGYALGSFYRTVTNVGYSNSTYYATVSAPENLKISVEPASLFFTQVGEKKSFVVKVDGGKLFQQPIMSACITWFDGVHSVRTPVVVFTTVLPLHFNDDQGADLRSIGKANFPRLNGNLMGN